MSLAYLSQTHSQTSHSTAQQGSRKRLPVQPEDIKKVQEECYKADDEKRWSVALRADTEIRLAEGAGLLRSDFFEQDEILCVEIRPNPWRSLKTASSERVIPLVGSAKWAADRILGQSHKTELAFPSYNDGDRTNANSASPRTVSSFDGQASTPSRSAAPWASPSPWGAWAS